jgi:hypothetical protein
MEKDFEILDTILRRLYSDKYAEMLLEYVQNKFDESDLTELTPNFIYYNTIYELGKKESQTLVDYFTQMKEKGFYETELEKYLKSKSHN